MLFASRPARATPPRIYGAQLEGQASSSSSDAPAPSGLELRDARRKKPTCNAPTAAELSGGPEEPSAAPPRGSESRVKARASRVTGSSRADLRAKPTCNAPSAANLRGSSQYPSNPRAFPSAFFEFTTGACGTFGCRMREFLTGPCSTTVLPQSRKRPSYAGMD